MRIYGERCGWSLARAHARSGDRIATAFYLGASDVFDQAITRFAAAYADQTERDHQSLLDAVASGRITAEPDMWHRGGATRRPCRCRKCRHTRGM
jgi:hypothetical protein